MKNRILTLCAAGLLVTAAPLSAGSKPEKPAPTPDFVNVLPNEVLNAVVIISGPNGAGTGFFCNFHGKPYLITNQHMLEAGPPLQIRTAAGDAVEPRNIFAATTADVALIECAAIPKGITPLEMTTLPDPDIHKGDDVIVPGNSKGDGVVTQTPGKLVAIGPIRVEVDNPAYAGNSGSPMVHLATKKVIGVFTEVELVSVDRFDKASFQSKNSSIKSEIRYFGHRFDSVKQWEPLNYRTFADTGSKINQSRTELGQIIDFFTGASNSYLGFKELHDLINVAQTITRDKNHSIMDKKEACDQFLRGVDALGRRAKGRLANCKIYYIQQKDADLVNMMSNYIIGGTTIIQQDNAMSTKLIQGGN